MKVLVTVDWDTRQIEAAFPQVEFVKAPTADEQMAQVGDAEILFGHVSQRVFLAAKKLRWLQCQGAGVDFMLKVPELVASNVVVTNTRGAHAATIAEHAFGMLIFLARDFRAMEEAGRRHHWARIPEERLLGLSGRTMGIIGLGNIGRAIARRAAAFDMRVIAVDALEVERPDCVAELRRLDGLDDLLSRSDVVVVSCPFTPETQGMIGSAQLAKMKPMAYLLAVSRGDIVDERALVAALKEKRIAGAGLDVQSKEPLPAESDLWETPNLLVSPHSAGRSEQTTDHVLSIFQENLGRYLAGQPLTHLVDKQRGF